METIWRVKFSMYDSDFKRHKLFSDFINEKSARDFIAVAKLPSWGLYKIQLKGIIEMTLIEFHNVNNTLVL